MASSRVQGGIQQLLAAEQEAQHIVHAAKNGKMARLKQANDEAEKEVAEHRAQVEYEFQKKLTKSSRDSRANVKRLEQETDGKILSLEERDLENFPLCGRHAAQTGDDREKTSLNRRPDCHFFM